MTPNNFKDITGQRYGRLVVISRAENAPNNEAQWLCQCDCGNETIVRGYHLRKGRIKSCGCYASECKSERAKHMDARRNVRHNGSKTRLYQIWVNMKTRCYNSNNKAYQWYGALGVIICEEWLDFAEFKKWALSSGYDDTLTIERINPFGNYEPKNCTWIPLKDQNKNKRSHPKRDTYK